MQQTFLTYRINIISLNNDAKPKLSCWWLIFFIHLETSDRLVENVSYLEAKCECMFSSQLIQTAFLFDAMVKSKQNQRDILTKFVELHNFGLSWEQFQEAWSICVNPFKQF